jgi:IS30 family transposase
MVGTGLDGITERHICDGSRHRRTGFSKARHRRPDLPRATLRSPAPSLVVLHPGAPQQHSQIYRALLLPNGRGLDTRYCSSLRTGRRIRKLRWLTRNGAGGAVQNMTMIDKRPADVETKKTAGPRKGDLILGTGCASAIVTLRERKTQYDIIFNLPHDHTAATVSQAVAGALAALPLHLKKALT